MPKPNVTRVQSATQWTASVHTLHMPKPNVTRVQSATQWTASVHTLHMPKPNVTCVAALARYRKSRAGQLGHAPGDAYDITKDHAWLFD